MKAVSFWEVVWHLLSTCMKNFRGFFLLSVALNMVAGFSMAATVVFKQNFFDSTEAAARGGEISTAIFWGVVMSVFVIAVLVIRSLDDVMGLGISLRLQSFLTINFHKKAAKVAAIRFEDSKFLDEVNKAGKGCEDAARVFSSFIYIVAFSVPYFLFMSVFLINLAPMLVLCVVLAFLPSVIGQHVRFKLYAKLEGVNAPLRRKAIYYERCINDREYTRETRLLGGFWFFRKLYETYMDLTAKNAWDTSRKTELLELVIRFVLLAGYVATIYLMYLYLIDGTISIGAFAAVFSSVDQLFNFMEGAVGYSVIGITENLGTVKNYMGFLAEEERDGEDSEIAAKGIRLENVGFTYPNAAKPSLVGINISISEEETIAIVGENGAGKSTIAKLITGLYLPGEGDVLIDGQSTRNLSPGSIYKNISGVFQRYQRYRLTLAENVAIGRGELCASSAEDINTALTHSEVNINDRSFPEGIDTMLSREFGGVDLSGGQWQRIAIARGLYRNHNLIILDEPTAAIDPVEETRIYKLFADLSRDKTAIVITHRLGSAKIADRIIVMDGGQIADTGTHDELMARDGVYKQMYEAQAQWYEKESATTSPLL